MNKLKIMLIPAVALAAVILLVFIFSDTPARSLFYFFTGPFQSIFAFGNMLNSAVPLILGAIGVSVAMKAGHLNLGGEGQIYLGAFSSSAVAVFLSGFGMLGALCAIIAGIFVSGAMAAFSGFCKARWNTNELITTFLLSAAVIPIVNYLVTGPFLDPDTSLLATKKINESMRLSFILKPSNLNTSFFISITAAVIVYFFLFKTKKGYEFRMAGLNELFARYGGINTKLNTVLSLAASGGFYGFAGSVAVLGTHHCVIKEFSTGLGWNALAVALIAGFNPAGVVPSAVFFAWINAGARSAMQNTGISYEIATIVQAVVILLATSMLVKNRFLQQSKKGETKIKTSRNCAYSAVKRIFRKRREEKNDFRN